MPNALKETLARLKDPEHGYEYEVTERRETSNMNVGLPNKNRTVIDRPPLNEQQQQAFDAMISYIEADAEDSDYAFIFKGLAGTGKTTVISHVLDYCADKEFRVGLVTPTGKAASVLNSKQNNYTAVTLHSVFYGKPFSKIDMVLTDIHNMEATYATAPTDTLAAVIKEKYQILDAINKASKNDLKFDARDPRMVSMLYDIIIVDEASMLNEKMVEDIEACGLKTIYVGDDNQLPPVDGKFGIDFKNFDVALTQVMRQTDGSNVLKMSRKILQLGERSGFMIGAIPKDFAPSVKYTTVNWSRDASIKDFLTGFENHQHVVFYNEKRHLINHAQRELMFPDCTNKVKHIPQPGELLMVDDNAPQYNLTKGDLLEFVRMKDYYDHTDFEHMWILDAIVIDKRTNIEREIPINTADLMLSARDAYAQKLLVKKEISGQKLTWYYRSRHRSIQVAFPYAITAYKAQGSEWDNVTVDTAAYGDKIKPYLYTAVTRAKQNVVMVF